MNQFKWLIFFLEELFNPDTEKKKLHDIQCRILFTSQSSNDLTWNLIEFILACETNKY